MEISKQKEKEIALGLRPPISEEEFEDMRNQGYYWDREERISYAYENGSKSRAYILQVA